MKVSSLKKLLKGTGTTVKKVTLERGQDPYVLYERTYQLSTKDFLSEESIYDFFMGNKKIVAADAPDDVDNLLYVVKFWEHRNQIVPKEIAAK